MNRRGGVKVRDSVLLKLLTGRSPSWLEVERGAENASMVRLARGPFLAASSPEGVGLPWLNRFLLTPKLERSIAARDHVASLSALRRSLFIEAAIVLMVIALVAWLRPWKCRHRCKRRGPNGASRRRAKSALSFVIAVVQELRPEGRAISVLCEG